MYVLTNISLFDLFIVCIITIACIVTMIGIIIVSSKPSKKKKESEIDVRVVEEAEMSPPVQIDEKPVKRKEEKTEIEDVLEKIEEEIKNGNDKKIHSFEELQEEKAIISYKELLKVAGKLKEENQKHDDELETRSVPKVQTIKEKEVKKEEKKFKSSEIISPIYGRIKNENRTENDRFLDDLKDLRRNLE